MAATAESASSHPLARAIVVEATKRQLKVEKPETAEVFPGRGAWARLNECGAEYKREIRVGNADFMIEAGVEGTAPLLARADDLGTTVVLVAEGTRLVGGILFRDQVREGVREALAALRELGLDDQRILTGDRQRVAEYVAREVGVTQVEAGLLPAQKVERIQALLASGRKPAMVGDGLNDAPGISQREYWNRRGRSKRHYSRSRRCRLSAAFPRHASRFFSESAGEPCVRPGKTSFCLPGF